VRIKRREKKEPESQPHGGKTGQCPCFPWTVITYDQDEGQVWVAICGEGILTTQYLQKQNQPCVVRTLVRPNHIILCWHPLPSDFLNQLHS